MINKTAEKHSWVIRFFRRVLEMDLLFTSRGDAAQ